MDRVGDYPPIVCLVLTLVDERRILLCLERNWLR
jgi:hypothetical protein